MTEEKKPVKIEFAPGCFDNFEGTQEELDAFIEEIQSVLTNMSPEELEAQSNAIDLDMLLEDDELSDDDKLQILRALELDDEASISVRGDYLQ